jgi:hypothetical protein
MRRFLCALGVAIGTASAALSAFQLAPATLASYDRYVALTEARVAAERAGTSPFLWLDRQPPANRAKILDRLRRGEVVVDRLETRDHGAAIDVDDGLIHHWVGTVLMPGVSVDRVVAFVQDYDRYPAIFAPMIPRTHVLRHDGDEYVVAMRTSVKKVITVVMDADYVVDYHRLSPTRLVTTTVATNLYQVHDAGTSRERREPGDAASGFLWRFRMYCAFDERAEGSLEQCESVTLTRDVPFAVSWLVKPFVTGIPRDTIAFTLGQVRAGLVTQAPGGEAGR